MQTDVLDVLLYADDIDKDARSEAKMQRDMDQVSQSCDNYDFTISTKKKEVVHQPAPEKQYNEPTITANGQKLKVVDFIYIGSTLILIMKSLSELQKPVWHSEDYVQMPLSEM